MFPAMPYLEWIEGRPEKAAYDLGSSDLRHTVSEATVVPQRLADLSDPSDETTLSAQLAAVYQVDAREVLVTAGATHANLLAAATALSLTRRPESESGTPRERQLLVEKPGYQPLIATPKALGARVDRFVRPPEEEYQLNPNRVEGAVTDNFALATVTNRHNPSGQLTNRETLAAVARVAADARGYLLVDEVYAPYVRTPEHESAFGGTTAAGLPNTVVTGSLTKFQGLGELRIGWLIAPEAFVDHAEKMMLHIPAVAEPSRLLARRALHNRVKLVDESRALLRDNHERLAAFAESRDDLSGTVHDGSTFAFFSHERAEGDIVADAAWEAGVLVVPGRFFDHPGSFRLSAGRDPKVVEKGLSALGGVLDEL